jgi:hypothetical protein
VLLYHYTSSEGCLGIMLDGVIRSSEDSNRDAILGKGVYLTALPPWTNDKTLIKNNWDGSRERAFLKKLDRVNFYLEFDSKHLPGVRKAPGKRDIWMVPRDIVLELVPHQVCVRGDNVNVARSHGYL